MNNPTNPFFPTTIAEIRPAFGEIRSHINWPERPFDLSLKQVNLPALRVCGVSNTCSSTRHGGHRRDVRESYLHVTASLQVPPQHQLPTLGKADCLYFMLILFWEMSCATVFAFRSWGNATKLLSVAACRDGCDEQLANILGKPHASWHRTHACIDYLDPFMQYIPGGGFPYPFHLLLIGDEPQDSGIILAACARTAKMRRKHGLPQRGIVIPAKALIHGSNVLFLSTVPVVSFTTACSMVTLPLYSHLGECGAFTAV